MTAVEDYLNSIRRNTRQSEKTTNKVNETIKELLHYEALKRAVADGVLDATNEDLVKLSKLSQQILIAQQATGDEILEIYRLLQKFYDMIPTTTAGTTQVTIESWVLALKEVLDEFGDSLPEKFQKRLKYDLVSAAQQGGANPQQVFQQLNVTQVNMQLEMKQFFSYMENRYNKIDLKAQAEKPKQIEEKRNKDNFWQTRMTSILDKLTGILGAVSKVGAWLGALYVGLAVWDQLKKSLRDTLQGIANLTIAIKGGAFATELIKKFSIGSKFAEALKKSSIGAALAKKFNNIEFIKNLKNAWADSKFLGVGAKNLGGGAQQLSLFDTTPYASKMTKFMGIIRKFGSVIGKAFKLIEPAMPTIQKILGASGKVLGKLAWPITAVASVYDFIQGFINTKGTVSEKIVGGLQNVIVKFITSIWDLIKSIPGLLWKAFIGFNKILATAFIKGLDWLVKSVCNVFKGFANFFTKGKFLDNMKSLFGGIGAALKNAISGGLGSIMETMASGIENTEVIKNIWGMDKLVDWLHTQASKLGAVKDKIYDAGSIPGFEGISAPGASLKMGQLTFDTGFNNSGITYTGNDAYRAMVSPLSGYATGAIPSAEQFKGINKAKGVKLSAQTADFITRAGLTGLITSGMDGRHKGTASNPRSHASGNKFDYGISGAISASALASELKKMLTTPGIREIRTEALPYSIVETARAMLEKEGIKTKGILFNDGYPSYATGPHLDVLIDPKYSGQKGTANTSEIASTTHTLDTPQSSGNAMADDLRMQIAKAQSEQIKLFEKGVKSPDQLAEAQSKKSTDKLVASMTPPSGNSGVTFNKQNDISDANLYAFYMMQV